MSRAARLHLLLAPLLAGCGVLRQIRPSLTLESEHVRLRERHEVFDAAVTALAVDAAGRLVAIGAYDGALAVLDLEEGELAGTPFRALGPRAGVAGIEPLEEPGAFAVLLSDGRVVEIRTSGEPRVRAEGSRPSAGVPSCRIVRGEGVRYREPARTSESTFAEPRAAAAAQRDGIVAVASGASPGTYRLAVLEKGVARFEAALGSPPASVALHPARPEVAVGGSGELTVLDFRDGTPPRRISMPGVVHVAYDPAGRFLYALHGERLAILPPGGAEPLAELSAHRSAALAIAVAPDGRTLATGGTRGEVWIWDVR